MTIWILYVIILIQKEVRFLYDEYNEKLYVKENKWKERYYNSCEASIKQYEALNAQAVVKTYKKEDKRELDKTWIKI